MKLISPLAVALAVLTVQAPASVIYTTDFETNQSASFTQVNAFTTGPDSQVDFNFSYNTHTQISGTVSTIIEAPNSAPGANKGLRITSNVSDNVPEMAAVNLYYNLTSALPQYKMKFDVWGNFTGDNQDDPDGTNMFYYGAAATQTVAFETPPATSITGDGFIFTITPNGAAVGDFRLYSGTSTITRTDALANYLGANIVEDTAPEWQTIFPALPPIVVAGAPGKRWNTIEMIVRTTVPNIQVFITPSGGSRVLISEIATAPGSTRYPMIGYSDVDAGVANSPTDQFATIDNFSIDDNPNSAVQDWALF